MSHLTSTLVVIALAALTTWLLLSASALLCLATRRSRSRIIRGELDIRPAVDEEVVFTGPRREELWFRFLPAATHGAGLLCIAAATVFCVRSSAEIDHRLFWILLLAVSLLTIPLAIYFTIPLQEGFAFDSEYDRRLAVFWLSVVLVPVVVALPVSFAPAETFADSLASVSAAMAGALVMHAGLIWSRSAVLFAEAHSMDSLTEMAMDASRYEFLIERSGYRWGAPYAMCLTAGSVLLLWTLSEDVESTQAPWAVIMAAAIVTVVGLPLSFVLTTCLHRAANRRARRHRDRVDPVILLIRRVAELLEDEAAARDQVVGLLRDFTRLQQEAPALRRKGDRSIALQVLRQLSGSESTARRAFEDLSAALLDGGVALRQGGGRDPAYRRAWHMIVEILNDDS